MAKLYSQCYTSILPVVKTTVDKVHLYTCASGSVYALYIISSLLQFTKNGVFITNGEGVQGCFIYLNKDLLPRFKSPIPEVSPIDPLPKIGKTSKEIKALEKAHSGIC